MCLNVLRSRADKPRELRAAGCEGRAGFKGRMLRIILDVDGTLTVDDPSVDYADRLPRRDVIDRVNRLHRRGATIVVYSARNMRTYRGNVGKVNKHALPVLIAWLERHSVAFDEIHMGKPWCGTEGFYVRERSMRPSQFLALPESELEERLGRPGERGAQSR